MKPKCWRILSLASVLIVTLAMWGATHAQTAEEAAKYRRITGPQTLNPGDWPAHWPYPDEYDSAVAASEVHHLRYVDSKVRFVEVAYFAGVHGQMHGHPWPSVFAMDAPAPPNSLNVYLDPDRRPDVGRWPGKMDQYPTCQTMGPQSPHAETNRDSWPHHFYRLEFMRVDGNGIRDHWEEWYPHMLDAEPTVTPAKAAANAPNLLADWPYPAELDSIRAAPNTNRLLYEDDHVRLVEVTLRPGETEAVHGDPYPAVLAMDFLAGETSPEDVLTDASSSLNGEPVPGTSPEGFPMMQCAVSGPRAPHALHNTGTVPVHYYRIEFKRIDGNDLNTRWREFYPWMSNLADRYKETPYTSNYQ